MVYPLIDCICRDLKMIIMGKWLSLPASMAHLAARPTCDQEITGSTTAGSAKFFYGD